MSWWRYVVGVAGTDAQVEIAKKVKVDQSTVSRWKNSDAPGKAENVAKLARAYGRPVLEAFVAANFLTADEARQRPAAQPSLEGITDDDLIELVATRIRRGGGGHADRSPSTSHPASGPGLSVVDDKVGDLVAADEQEQSISGEQEGVQEP